jgi:hypothetical protein
MDGDYPLSEAEVSARIRSFEDEYRLFEAEVDGVKPWQLIRFETALAVQRLKITRQPISKSRLLSSIPKAVGQWVGLPRKILYACKTFDSSIRVRNKDGYDDIYFDWLLRHIEGGVKLSSCDATGYQEKLKKASLPPAFDDTSIIVSSAFLARIKPKYRQHRVFEEISAALKSNDGFPYIGIERIAAIYNTFWWRGRMYRMLLRRMNPAAVLVADGGQFALMAACRSLAIKYIELQHGVATSVHPNIIPSGLTPDKREKILLPDIFAVYGQHSIDALKGSALHAEGRLVAAGSASVDELRSGIARNKVNDGKVVVTLTTQGVATDQLIDFMSQFLSLCTADVMVNIKLHPAYDADRLRYKEKFSQESRVSIWDMSSNVNTQELIVNSDIHISVSSTCHYDALGIGTPTGVLTLETHETVQELEGVEGVVFISSANQLADMVRNRSFPAVPKSTMAHFFADGFVENIGKIIQTRA